VLQAHGIDAQQPQLLVRHLVAAGELERAAVHAERAALRSADAPRRGVVTVMSKRVSVARWPCVGSRPIAPKCCEPS
jgi:hypothetical protein